MASIIYIPTIQASGTWFILNLLTAHDKVGRALLFGHWSDSIIKEVNAGGSLENDNIVALQNHYGEDPKISALMENIFAISDHIVTPIRNPLRAILTAYIKQGPLRKNWAHPYIRHDITHMVNGYIELTELIKKHNIFIVPVDLYLGKSRVERYFLLRDLFDFVQLPYNHYMKKLANTWQKSNTVGNREESVRLLFDTKNVEGIKQIIPKGYDLLIQSKDILKPFFESHGYSKEDLWYW